MPATATKEQPMANVKVRRFRLLSGGHYDQHAYLVQPDGAVVPSTRKVALKDEDGRLNGRFKFEKLINDGRGFEIGDILQLDVDENDPDKSDLVKKFPGKFEETSEGARPLDNEKLATANDMLLERMTIPALQKLAEDEEIDLDGAELKADIIKVIQSAMAM